MPINATCQKCGAVLPVPDEYAGQSVRCGGCQGVVQVPATGDAPAVAGNVPVARAAKPRPVAVPVAAKVRAEPKAEVPLPKARKEREPDEPEDDDTPKKRVPTTRRPIAKRRRESVLSGPAVKWLFLCLTTGVVGLGVLLFAAWGASRKNDGTALVPAAVDNKPVAAPPPAPVLAPPPVRFEPPVEMGVPGGLQPVMPVPPRPGGQEASYPNHRPAVVAAPVVRDLPFRQSTNAVLVAQTEKFTASASSQFDAASWSVRSAFDNSAGTSWYSQTEGNGSRPWVQVAFERPATVSRVVVLGNRDQFADAYTVTAGTLTLTDTAGREVYRKDLGGRGAKFDFEFALPQQTANVAAVRFTATASKNVEMCVAVGELQVE